jgi:hypothetical protein
MLLHWGLALVGGAETIPTNGAELQQVIDAAPTNATLVCDPNHPFILSTPLTIRKPLTLRGLHARLPEKLGKTPLVIVVSKGVTVVDFELTGNGDTVSQDVRAPLLEIKAGEFRVENGRLNNSSKDGIMISAGDSPEGDIVGGVVRDLVGRSVIRDLVSISGGGRDGRRIRDVLVDNVRCYGSALRGAVEVSDGTDNITVRKVYAESSVYAIDIQDHNKTNQINRNVVIEDVYAWRCKHAIRTADHPFGHANVTLRDITARQCAAPLQISHINNLALQNVRVLDHESDNPPVFLLNCHGAAVRDLTVENATNKGPALLVQDCDGLLIDGLVLRGKTAGLSAGVCFRLTKQEAFSNVLVSHVSAPNVQEAGIILESGKKKGTLTDYLISGNLATVSDRIQGQRRLITGNLPGGDGSK